MKWFIIIPHMQLVCSMPAYTVLSKIKWQSKSKARQMFATGDSTGPRSDMKCWDQKKWFMYKDLRCFTPRRGAGEEVEEVKQVQNSKKISFWREVLSFSYVSVQTYEANLSLGGQMIGFDFSYILWTLVKHAATPSNYIKFEECYMFLATIQLFIQDMSCT